MTERYLTNQRGIVEEVYLPGKAILSFHLHDEPQRALLWIKGFIYQGNNLEQNDTFQEKLTVGDLVIFDCHTYDRESKDNCGWYAPKAYKDIPGEESPSPSGPRIMNQTGYIFDLDPGKGVIQFYLNDQEQRVLFLRSKFYHFGKRPGNKHTLSEFLSENDPVQFNAEMCEPTVDNKMCHWFASIVWKGKKPPGMAWSGSCIPGIDDDTVSIADEDMEFPMLAISQKQGYRAFESNSSPREGKGNVVALINEECGIALWMIKQNTWETVFFHRKYCYLMDTSLSKFDLTESFVAGTPLEITAVPAVQEFPCRWIAHKAVAPC